MDEGLNVFKLPFIDNSVILRTDTDYYPSDAAPDNSKEAITIEVTNKSEVDFIDLNFRDFDATPHSKQSRQCNVAWDISRS